MSHIEKYSDVPHGWWLHKRNAPDLPTTIADPRNYVLRMPELQEYADVLSAMKDIIDKQLAKAQHTLKVAKNGTDYVVSMFDRHPPQVFTLCHVLDFEVKLGKQRLLLTQQLNETAKHAVELKRKRDAADAAGHQDHVVHDRPDAPGGGD